MPTKLVTLPFLQKTLFYFSLKKPFFYDLLSTKALYFWYFVPALSSWLSKMMPATYARLTLDVHAAVLTASLADDDVHM